MGIEALRKYKNIIDNSFDIIDNLILKSTYAMIIIDKNFQVVFTNELALRLLEVPIDDIFMKNYLGVFTRDPDDYDEFCDFYAKIAQTKEPIFINNNQNNTCIRTFPLLSSETGEVEYFLNIFTLDKSRMNDEQKDNLRFSNDYIHFAQQLSLLLDAKDKYTESHSSNVTKYSDLLARAVGIHGIELEKLKLAANLHDIGKINIGNDILNKPGKLNAHEFEQIKHHTIYSGKILDPFKKLGNIDEAGLHHHERFDGAGYPFGLSGRNIPLNARIISIADAFDAMTTDRYYREAMPLEYAINELKVNKGGQFDPFLVDKFLNLNLEKEVKSHSQFKNIFIDEYTVSDDNSAVMTDNMKILAQRVDPYTILENLVSYNFYGLAISKDSGCEYGKYCNRSDIFYKNDVFKNFECEGYLEDNWEMCLKTFEKAVCRDCPVAKCISVDSTFIKKSMLVNPAGDVKFVDTLLHPVHNKDDNETYIVEIFKDETVSIEYGNELATEFFEFTDNISKMFGEKHGDYSIIYNNMRGLANWIGDKVYLSEHRTLLLNKAISICDLGLIGLYDSNEHSFESLINLRFDKKHIEIIYDMITRHKTFSDIKDIVLYHHTNYDDTNNYLSGDEVPIQSYIISISDYLLTNIVMGKSAEDALALLETASGTLVSPSVCDAILKEDAKKELLEILKNVIETL